MTPPAKDPAQDTVLRAIKAIPGVIDAQRVGYCQTTGIAKYSIVSEDVMDDSQIQDREMMLADVHPKVWAVTLRMIRNGRIYHYLTLRYDTVQPRLPWDEA
jgi:hypothetical protein